MTKRITLVRLLGGLAFLAAPTLASAQSAPAVEKTVEVNRAAKVALVEGDVSIFSVAKVKRNAVVGAEIIEGESIVTGKDSELHLEMEDGGYISVRPNTKMRIIKYQAKGESTDVGVFGLLEGGFRSVTGWIGKFNRDSYKVNTPTATIGIRGTDHEPYVIPKGSSAGDPGTYDKVNEGGSFIQTPGGRAEVSPNQAGFVSHDKGARPRLLKDVPALFRPGKHEQLFAGKHAEVQKRIEKRREDRRAEIRQRMQKGKSQTDQLREQRQQLAKERREAAQKQREGAKKAKEDAKMGKAEKRELKEEEGEKGEKGEKGEGKAHSKAHPAHKG